MTQQPQAKYRHDYRAPDYQITDIDLTFDWTRKDGRYRGQPGCPSWCIRCSASS